MTDEVVAHLLDLAKRLRAESAGFLDDPGDGQQWYNRGYGGGILQALRESGHAERLDADCADDPESELASHRVMAWGQAYEHGRDKGRSDTLEALARYGLMPSGSR